MPMRDSFAANKPRPAGRAQEIDKPNSVTDPKTGGDHFSRPLIAQRLKQSTRETGDEPSLYGPLARPATRCLTLLPLGVAWPDTLPRRR